MDGFVSVLYWSVTCMSTLYEYLCKLSMEVRGYVYARMATMKGTVKVSIPGP